VRRKRGNPTPSAEHGDGLKRCTLRREHALGHWGGDSQNEAMALKLAGRRGPPMKRHDSAALWDGDQGA
jgi:hypothetical protein